MPPTLIPRSGRLSIIVSCAFLSLLAGPSDARAEALHDIGPAEYVADLLIAEPEGEAVVIGDMLAGTHDLEDTADHVRDLFSDLGVPFHVYASPSMPYTYEGRAFLSEVAERVGADGLYVHIADGSPRVRTVAVGVDTPVEDVDGLVGARARDEEHSSIETIAEIYVETLLDPALEEWAENPWHVPPRDPLDEEGGDRSSSGLLDPDRPGASADAGLLVGTVGGALIILAVVRVRVLRRRYRASKEDLPGTGAVVGAVAVAAVLAIGAGAATSGAVLGRSENPASVRRLSSPPHVTSTERIDRIVEGWGDTPLYVDPHVRGDRIGLTRIGAGLEEGTVPVRAALMVQHGSDESAGVPDVLAYALAHTYGEEGVYVVLDVIGGRVGTAFVGARPTGEGFDWSPPRPSDPDGAALAESLHGLADAFGDTVPDPTVEPRVPPEVEEWIARSPDVPRGPGPGFLSDGLLPGLFVVGPLLGAALSAAHLFGTRLVRRAVPIRGRRLRAQAEREARRMLEDLERAPNRTPGLSEATAEADVALAALHGDPDDLDLLGVIVLARRARGRLSGTVSRPSVCMLDPLHGPAEGRGRPRHTRRRIPLCAECLRLPEEERVPLLLRIGSRIVFHGTAERVWGRTWYGTREVLERHMVEEERVAR
ncbi:hypothetical protein ABZ645_23440 [Nocardiopsis alba]|uniref:hypothetical protein n=1 Tax=Nocardiopsis alba TaxID=53437 RepID=UPI0034070821